jgi:hypothetical protein
MFALATPSLPTSSAPPPTLSAPPLTGAPQQPKPSVSAMPVPPPQPGIPPMPNTSRAKRPWQHTPEESKAMFEAVIRGVPDLNTARRQALAAARLAQAPRANALDRIRAASARARAQAATCLPYAAALLLQHASLPHEVWVAIRGARAAYDDAVAGEMGTWRTRHLASCREAGRRAENARVMCLDALLTATIASNPPRLIRLPVREMRFDDLHPFDAQRQVVVSRAAGALPYEHVRLIEFLEDKGRELLSHALAHHPRLHIARTLNVQWTRRVLAMSAEYERVHGGAVAARGVPGSKSVFVNASATTNVARALYDVVRALSGIGGDARSPHLLRIATEELGWTVEAGCPCPPCPKCVTLAAPKGCRCPPPLQRRPAGNPRAGNPCIARTKLAEAAGRAAVDAVGLATFLGDDAPREPRAAALAAAAHAQARRCVEANNALAMDGFVDAREAAVLHAVAMNARLATRALAQRAIAAQDAQKVAGGY